MPTIVGTPDIISPCGAIVAIPTIFPSTFIATDSSITERRSPTKRVTKTICEWPKFSHSRTTSSTSFFRRIVLRYIVLLLMVYSCLAPLNFSSDAGRNPPDFHRGEIPKPFCKIERQLKFRELAIRQLLYPEPTL